MVENGVENVFWNVWIVVGNFEDEIVVVVLVFELDVVVFGGEICGIG